MNDHLPNLHRRRTSYTLVAGAVAAVLLVGLVVAYGFGSSNDDDNATRLTVPTDVSGSATASSMPATSESSAPAATTAAAASATAGESAAAASTIPHGGMTDVGVTDDSIKVAIFEAAVGGFAASGNEVEVDDQRRPWQVFYDDLNANGGIGGRLIDYQFVSFDILDPASMRAACIRATEDLEVFAVTSAAVPLDTALECIIGEHDTPVMTHDQITYERASAGDRRLWTLGMSVDRLARNMMLDLADYGMLDDAVVGVIDREPSKEATEASFIGGLESLGYRECGSDPAPPCYVYRTLSGGGDLSLVGGEANAAVEAMHGAGVDRLILSHSIFAVSSICSAAEGRQWRPQIFAAQMTVGLFEEFPDACTAGVADGALGFTSTWFGERPARAPLRPAAAECRERYESLTGEDVDPYQPGTGPLHGIVVTACLLTDLFASAVEQAGPDLTRDAFVDALAETGEIPGGISFPGSWAPTKPDAADFVRTVEYDARECRCWTFVDEEPRPAR